MMLGFPLESLWRKRSEDYFNASRDELASSVDRMFAWLLAAEWIGMMVIALAVSPRLWNGGASVVHPHVWAAILAGPAFILPAVAIAYLFPAHQLTRHAVATAQMLVSILLIDITGGRIETHFHIFGSLAFLAFYRDWRVLATASALTAADHVIRGMWWPESVYGILTVSPWRWVEHAWWVVFEDFFLLTGMRRSIREMRAVSVSRAQLYAGAYHDVLTGLANRRFLRETFEKRPQPAAEPARALLFLDLDRFKQANDTLGHTIGDKLLQQVGARLSAAINPSSTLARIGGDEFVILMENIAGEAEAIDTAAHLLDALATPFVVEGHEFLLSASVGIGLCPEHGSDLTTLQERADQAMYVAKSRGRNQYAVFSREMAQHESRMQEIGRDLYRASTNGEFHLHFQPLVERSGRLTGFEALLRWTHPVYGAIPPGDFIPLAEKSGLIVSLGDWVLREACRNCKTWQRRGEDPLGVAVNVSASQFDQPHFQEQVEAILNESGMDPCLLTLELTETVLLRDVAQAHRQLSAFRAAGIRIALDDFGTRYSSLSYLTTLPADTIKLDRSFVNREFRNASAVLESVIEMAHRVGLRVVGEGVETQAQSDRLTGMHCDEMQGFYFSRPMPEDEVNGYVSSVRADRGIAAEPADVLLEYETVTS